MYAYIYDEFTNQSKYNKILHKIEKRLTDLGINGKTARLGVSKKLETAVLDQIRGGAKTIVAIGDNQTVCRVLNVLAGSENHHSLTMGIIPIDDKDNYLSNLMGIKNMEEACNILLARRVEKFKLAKINKNYFLFKLDIQNPKTILEINQSYAIKNYEQADIVVTNIPHDPEKGKKERLKLLMKTKANESFFPLEELLIINEDAGLIADNSLPLESPARIKPCEKELKIIIGKNRIY